MGEGGGCCRFYGGCSEVIREALRRGEANLWVSDGGISICEMRERSTNDSLPKITDTSSKNLPSVS